jgi:hypothetical protein
MWLQPGSGTGLGVTNYVYNPDGTATQIGSYYATPNGTKAWAPAYASDTNGSDFWDSASPVDMTWSTACAYSVQRAPSALGMYPNYNTCTVEVEADNATGGNISMLARSGGFNPGDEQCNNNSAGYSSVSCSGDIINGWIASCDQPNNWGYVSANSWCPSGPYCMKGGNVAAGTGNKSGPSYCPAAFTQPQANNNSASKSCTSQASCTAAYCGANLVCNNGIVDNTGAYCKGGNCGCSAAVTAPTNLTIDGNNISTGSHAVSAGAHAISWTAATSGADHYIVVVDDKQNGMAGTKGLNGTACAASQNAGDSCTTVTGATSYTFPYTAGNGSPFQAGHSYDIYVYTANAPSCGNISGTALTDVTPVPPTCSTGQTYPYGSCQNGACVQNLSCGTTNCAACPIPQPPCPDPNSICALTTIKGEVYIDYNGNGALNVGTDIPYKTAPITITLKDQSGNTVTTTKTSVVDGTYSFANVVPGTYTVSIAKPAGYDITDPPVALYPPTVYAYSTGVTQNFGIHPLGPVCTGQLTAVPNQIYVGGNPPPATSTLSIVGCVPGGGAPGVVNYTWSTAAQGTIAQVNAATTTYTPPTAGSTYTQVGINPSVSVCNPGGVGASCTVYPASLMLLPTFKAKGMVYIDANKNGQLDAGEQPYKGIAPITICQGNQPGGCQTPYETIYTNSADGTFDTSSSNPPLLPGSYTAIFTPPSGYDAIFPKPPVAFFTVGNASTGNTCTANAPADCTPDGSGNVENLNFGIYNGTAWMQVIGGDASGSYISNPGAGDITDRIPSTADSACSGGAYAVVNGEGGTHGIINTGAGGADFGQGQAAAAQNWIVGGIGSGNYPDVYNMPLSEEARTSYDNLSYLIGQSNVQTTPLDSYCGSGGPSNCQLPTDTSTIPPGDNTGFISGVYTVKGDLNLQGSGSPESYTFPANGSYVILVSGKLTINTKVFVPGPDVNGANGSFVLFSVKGDIDVAPTVGDDAYTLTPNLEGFYSTDNSFNVQGTNDCSSQPDLRLNVEGSIVVNAVTTNGGALNYARDLCANSIKCPVLTVTERPDFVLDSPPFLMFPRRLWQEVAP